MPANHGIACVLIPGLDSRHEGFMVELLSKLPAFSIIEAGEGVAVEANHVYIIPPSQSLSIRDGVLRLSEPSERPVSALVELTQRQLLEEYAPAAVLIDSHGKILFEHGSTLRYLDPTTGESALDLLRMARGGLRTKLRTAVHKALRDRQRVSVSDARVKREGAMSAIRLIVRPISVPSSVEDFLLVAFEDLAEPVIGRTGRTEVTAGSRVQKLERELRDTREDLRSTVDRDRAHREMLEGEILQIAERERTQLGQDLHDDIGQELTGLGLIAETLVTTLNERSPSEVELASKLAQGIQRSLSKLRELSRGLVPVEIASERLPDALAELAARISEQNSISCMFRNEKFVSIESSVTATQLYRIAQESVSNALRHGRAGRIQIDLEEDDGLVLLRIQDDGIGIQNRGTEAAGIGLRIMRHRAGLINATLNIGPAEGGGTLVVCTLYKEPPR